MIHQTAIIDSTAKIAPNVTIGPYSVIGPEVEIGEGTWVGPHVVIQGPTKIGKQNKIYQFASLGEDPQDKKFKGERTFLEVGDANVFREFCTINRGTVQDKSMTRIGDGNLFMSYVHIAHDCVVGNHTVFANNASLAGHVIVEDYAILGGFSGILQHCRMGSYGFASMGALVDKDVPPFVKVAGHYAKPFGLNKVGMQRLGFSTDQITLLTRAYKTIYRKKLTLTQAIDELKQMVSGCETIQLLVNFLEGAERGIVR